MSIFKTHTQATLAQLQGDLECLEAQHSQTAAELSALQTASAALKADKEGLGEKVQGLEAQLQQVRGCVL